MRNLANENSTFVAPNYDIDQFDELSDLRWSDLVDLEEYRELKMKKNDGLHVNQARLDELEAIFQNKIVTSSRWNKFQNALVGMQGFIKNEVEGYVDGKQIEINGYVDTKKEEIDFEVEQFAHKGTYNPAVQYYERNVVAYNDGAGVREYLCIQDALNKVPTNATYWRQLTIQGVQGDKGDAAVGLVFKGAWDSAVSYSQNDGVQYGGVLFASLVDTNIDNTPDLSADTAYWAKALDVTVTVEKMIGYRSIATQTSNVNFMTGEIVAFNPNTDTLEVYVNSTRLTKGVDYTLNVNNVSINKTSGFWNGNQSVPVFFEFVVTRNQLGNTFVFNDGQSIADDTIGITKLNQTARPYFAEIAPDTPYPGQVWINTSEGQAIMFIWDGAVWVEVGVDPQVFLDIEQAIGDLEGLTTTEKSNLVGAINELELSKADASQLNNYTIVKDGTDGAGLINFKTV